MADIIVTTPKAVMALATEEAEQCIKNGGGTYFRKLGKIRQGSVKIGDRIFYVEDGYIRGYATIMSLRTGNETCSVSGKIWDKGVYAFMDAKTWTWIKPIPMRGFQGWRYFKLENIEVVGDWLNPKPQAG